MPIHEFYCPDNNKLYSFFARTLAVGAKTPRCPDNPKFRMERMLSQFSVTGRAKEAAALPGGADADDPRMVSVMAEMEREMAGMDENNPDPRVMARMMRKMSALTGGKMPAQMEEMIGRMEAGEDPESLEAEYGDEMKAFEEGAAGGEEGDAGSKERRKLLRAHLRSLGKRPVRDPQLYEMSEFLR